MVCFSPNRLRSRFDYKGQVAKCDRTQTTDSITKKGIMDTEKNPNEREKQGGGQQGGGQQGGGQKGGGQQGGGQQGGGQQGGGRQEGR